MPPEVNVEAFCRELRRRGRSLLDGVDPRLELLIDGEIQDTDICGNFEMTAALEDLWESGPEHAVREALEYWRDAIRERMDRLFGFETLFPWKQCGFTDDQLCDLMSVVDLIELRNDPAAIAALISAASAVQAGGQAYERREAGPQ